MSEQELWNELGNLYFLTGSFDPAIHAYSRAIQLDELFGRPYSNLALAYVQKGNYEQAVRLYQFSIDRLADEKEKAATWNKLGTVHRLLKDYKSALIAFQRADELDPQSYEEREVRRETNETPLNFSTLPFIMEIAEAHEESSEVDLYTSEPDMELSTASAEAWPISTSSEFVLIESEEDLPNEHAQLGWPLDWDTREAFDLPAEEESTGSIMPELEAEKAIWKVEFPDEIPGQAEVVEETVDEVTELPDLAEVESAQVIINIDSQISEEALEESIPALAGTISIEVTEINDSESLLDLNSVPDLILNQVVESVDADLIEPIEAQATAQNEDSADFIVESFVVNDVDAEKFFAEVLEATDEINQQISLDAPVMNDAQSGGPLIETGAPHEVQINEALVLMSTAEEADNVDAFVESHPESQIVTDQASANETADETSQAVEWTSGDAEELDFQISKFMRKVKASPDNAFAWDMLGNLHRLAGNYNDAETAYEQAISNEPKNPEFHYHLGLVYAAQMRHEEAVSVLRETLEIDSSYYHAHATLGGYYRKLGLEELARHHINKAIKLGFQNDSEYNRACLEAICGRTEQALMLLEKALQNHQSNSHWAKNDPDLEFIRSDPRFQNLITAYAG